MLQNGIDLVLLNSLRHHIHEIGHDRGTQLKIKMRLHSLLCTSQRSLRALSVRSDLYLILRRVTVGPDSAWIFSHGSRSLYRLQDEGWLESTRVMFYLHEHLLSRATPHVKAQTDAALRELRMIVSIVERFDVLSKLYIAPFSCINAKFYQDGMMFRCLRCRARRRHSRSSDPSRGSH